MSKTIKQLADELGVSKQAIRKRVNQLPPTEVSTGANRAILINDDSAAKIRESINAHGVHVTTNQVHPVDAIISMLQVELESKNATIESQSRQLEQAQKSIQDLTAALTSAQLSAQQAQALHAGTIHKQLADGSGGPEEAEEEKKGWFSRLFR